MSPTSIDRRFLIPTPFEDSQLPNTTSSTLNLHSSSAPHMRRLLTNNYFSNGGGLSSSGNGSVCPRAAEAWNLLAIFIIGQMRFAYELERLLQVEIKRLGLTSFSSSTPSSPTSTTSPSLQNQQQQQHNVQFSIA
uniref:Uncharacterized protein n=1 Tax=Panagrolaimus sp. PS1159 TaxID=55785 RepID=A0AC35GTJ7_9BILA